MEDTHIDIKTTSNDIKNYLLKLVAHWYFFVISLIISYSYNYIDSRYTQILYTCNSTMVLQDELQSTQAVLGGLDLFDKRKNYETEFGVLKSYALNESAIKELGFEYSYFIDEKFKTDIELYKKTPFIVIADTSKKQTEWLQCNLNIVSENEYILKIENYGLEKRMKFGQNFESEYLNFKIIKNEKVYPDFKQFIGNEYFFYKNNLTSVAKSFQNALNVDLRSPNSSILWLWIEGTVSEKIVDYLNKLSEVYLKQSLDSKNRIAYNTILFIDEQLQGVVDSLDDVENKLQYFKQSNNILDIDKETEVLFNDLDKVQKEKKMLEIKRSFYEYFSKDLSKNGELTTGISPSSLDISDSKLEGLMSSYQNAKSEIEILNYDIKKNVPNLDIAQLKLNSIQNDIKMHVEYNLKAISNNYASLDNKIHVLDSSLRRVPEVEREIQIIQRKYKLNDNIYTFLLQKRTEAGITMASNSPGAKILDVAKYENVIQKMPQGQERNTRIIFFTILIPVLIIVIKEFFNNKIIDKTDIEKGSRLPIMGSISRNMQNEEIPVFKHPKSPVAESFRLVKTNLQYMLVEKTNPIISINSTISGEGKTFCSTNMAVLYARNKKKTLLIGLDLRKPRTHLLFENTNKIGISTYLIGINTIDEIIFKTEIENLYLLPSGPIPPNPAELIESDKMKELMAELKSMFEYIIIDTPPVAHVADALLIAKFTDANLFVIRQNYSSKNVLKIVEELRGSKKMINMGIVINDVNPSVIFGLKFGYGFSYGYNYGYGYEEGQGYYDNDNRKISFFKRISLKFYSKLEKLIS